MKKWTFLTWGLHLRGGLFLISFEWNFCSKLLWTSCIFLALSPILFSQQGSLALGVFCLFVLSFALTVLLLCILYYYSQYLLPLPAIVVPPPCRGLDFLILLKPSLVIWLSLANENTSATDKCFFWGGALRMIIGTDQCSFLCTQYWCTPARVSSVIRTPERKYHGAEL